MQQLNGFNLPWPADWPALFGRQARLILEIGFGRGAFLLHLGQTNPDANVVGIEISNRSLIAAERAVERQQIPNIRVIHAPAEMALAHLFAPASLSEIHINFPDPWFKSEHQHRRLIQRDTLDMLVSRLAPEGRFYLATDIRDYADMSAALLRDTPGLDNLLPDDWASSLPGRVVTKYEATAQLEGRDRYYFAYRRNASPPPDVPPIKELDMPHLVFETPLTLDDLQARFEPRRHVEGETIVSLMDVFRGRHSLLFEVHVKEPATDQHIAVLLTHHLDGTFTLSVSTLGHPRATAGIHRAVSLLAAWMASLDPETRILRSSLQNAKD